MRAWIVSIATLTAVLAVACSPFGGPDNFTVLSKGQDSNGCFVRYHLHGDTQEWRGIDGDCNITTALQAISSCYALAAVDKPLPSDCRT